MNPLLNNWKNTRSYVKREALMKTLAEKKLDTCKGMIVVKTPDDRWTAIFGKSFLGSDFITVANLGFKVLG